MTSNNIVDVHVLWHAKALTKVRTFISRGGASGNGSGTASAGARTGLSSSLSKSPNQHYVAGSQIASALVNSELNRRDERGRTVLHLACSETEASALEWIELLLSVNGLSVNLADEESGWTALHRAMYVGNVAAARMLLGRQDIDARVKDHEGLTPFDLYNSTVEGTNPSDSPAFEIAPRMDLLTWGANRNYVLGFAGDSDRSFPERINLRRDNTAGIDAHAPVRVKDVSMARLHSAIVTDEPKTNVRLCGYGTGGRLGQSGHTIFTFTALKDFPQPVSSVVLSPDHTVIVTASGAVWTFGTNRFSQLGYTIDTPSPAIPGGVPDEAVQMAPRKVLGALKKEVVLGAAASRTHTVAYTADSLFTWGTNKGQLGYAVAGSSVQLLPRKVTAIAQPVIMATATENATACLLESRDIVVLWREGYVKIAFPMSRFPTRMQVYHPPQFSGKANITKITSCGSTFAALSSHGDVFTFTLGGGSTTGIDSIASGPSPSQSESSATKAAPMPQRIWSLRRKFTAVTDIAVGLDGTVILSTVSGHVFLRKKKFETTVSKLGSSAPTSGSSTPVIQRSSSHNTSAPSASSSTAGWKFTRIPYLQRVVKVAANSTGGFAAIRYDVPLKPIDIEGASLAQDLSKILPHWRRAGSLPIDAPSTARQRRRRGTDGSDDDGEGDEGESDAAIEMDVQVALILLSVISQWSQDWEEHLGGSDAYLIASVTSKGGKVERKRVPVHRSILACRSSVFSQLLSNSGDETIELDCSFFALLLFVQYLYTDSIPPIWDSRVGHAIRHQNPAARFDVAKTKGELQTAAKRFGLDALSASLQYHSKHSPAPTLAHDMGTLIVADSVSLADHDIVLALADRDVLANSEVLRARCHFFETLYEESEWTANRRESDEEGEPMRFEMDHVEWDVMRLVMSHIYTDAGVEMFHDIERATADDFIDYVLQVMAVANELLLDKLKSVCSAVLATFVTLNNVCSILSEAAFYEATDLARACLLYMACSMETLLEGRYLDDLPPELLSALSTYVQERQSLRLPISRSGLLVSDLLMKHSSWLAEQDIPKMTGGYRKWRPHVARAGASTRSPGPSPSMLLSPDASPLMKPYGSPSVRPAASSSPVKSPYLLPRAAAPPQSANAEDEPFSMDDFSLDAAVGSPTKASHTLNDRRRSSATVITPSSTTVLGSPPPTRLQPWSSSSSAGQSSQPKHAATNAAKTDLRSIMAIEEKRAVDANKATNRPVAAQRQSSSSWKPTGQGWQIPANGTDDRLPRPSLSSIQSQQQSPAALSTPVRDPPGNGRALSSSGTRPLDARTAINAPVFTPSRPSAGAATSARSNPSSYQSNRSFTGGDVPWTNYGPSSPALGSPSSFVPPSSSKTALASSKTATTTTTTTTMTTTTTTTIQGTSYASLASIQSEQQAQDDAIKSTKAPRSFADLIKADESAARARAEEEAFAKWWEEESKRVQGVAHDAMREVPVTASTGAIGGGKKRGGGPKKGSSRGSNRGKGKGVKTA